MKLEILKPEVRIRKGVPCVSIMKNGGVVFNQAATSRFDFIQKDARIAFCEDKHQPGEWYIIPSVAGYVISRYKKTKMGYDYLQFQAVQLRNAIMDSLEISGKKPIRFRIATEPTEWNGQMYHALMLLK